MIRLSAVFLAVAAPAAAQVAPLSFEAGKSLALATGQWSYVATATGSEARYGALLALQCDKPSRTMVIARPGMPVAALTIVTDTASRTLPPTGRLSADDPLLDAMAFSRGRFLVSGGAGPALAVPSWPESARAIEDCRN
ncbi:MAG TPA: hypothetical protein VFO12_08630 [Sphingomicrobium sp.]|nr:hypothetical protein [Sphingomicrobium sp.]